MIVIFTGARETGQTGLRHHHVAIGEGGQLPGRSSVPAVSDHPTIVGASTQKHSDSGQGFESLAVSSFRHCNGGNAATEGFANRARL
ncbi:MULTISPECIES: hypothetical protein [Ensifer]|uniref:hypothetical protein n=1 Tax=Ensifer TaxID=106591 RepID=UPI00159EBFF0|nr:hypothetical protein [Ensifer adhaerens]